MGEQEAATRVRNDDLAGVQVTGEDQAPAIGRSEVEDPREVAEKQSKRCVRRREAAASLGAPRPRVDACDLDPTAAFEDLDALVLEQAAAGDVAE
jgi:hypothetical protein